MRKLYVVIDDQGAQTQAVESISHGEADIARDFGISWADLANYQAKRRNSKSFIAFQSAGKFREIVSVRAGS